MVSLSQNENGSMVCLPNEKKTFDILKIDRIAFVVVGALFVLFNITYWVIFLAFDFNWSILISKYYLSFEYQLQGNVMECIIVYLSPHQSFLERRAYFYFVKGAWRAYSVCLPTVWPISDLYLPSGAPLYGLWVIMGYGLWGYGEAKISVNTCLSVLHLSYSGRFKHSLKWMTYITYNKQHFPSHNTIKADH